MNRRRMMMLQNQPTTYKWEKWNVEDVISPASGGGQNTNVYKSVYYPFTAYRTLNSNWQSAVAFPVFSNSVSIPNQATAQQNVTNGFYVPTEIVDGHIVKWIWITANTYIYSDRVMHPNEYYKNTTTVQQKGSTSYGTVGSSNRYAYPDNGVQDGYWYVFVS